MKIEFEKYHGAGNDFIMVDSRINDILLFTNDYISMLCDRHFGIGADGLIILNASKTAAFKMDYYNADGRPGTMCGNGGRCTTAFAAAHGWIAGSCVFEAADGLHKSEILKDGQVKLQMSDVSTIKSWKDGNGTGKPGDHNLSDDLKTGYFLDTGSPHLVLFAKDINNLDLKKAGPQYRYHPDFPDGTNVNFVEIREKDIKVRSYERGVEAETLSCGTGVTASAIAAGLFSGSISSPVHVKTAGGQLIVHFEKSESETIKDVWLTGPVRRAFQGYIE